MKISVKLMTMVLNTVNAKKVGKVKPVPLQLAKILITVATMETVLQVKMVRNKSASVKKAGKVTIVKHLSVLLLMVTKTVVTTANV